MKQFILLFTIVFICALARAHDDPSARARCLQQASRMALAQGKVDAKLNHWAAPHKVIYASMPSSAYIYLDNGKAYQVDVAYYSLPGDETYGRCEVVEPAYTPITPQVEDASDF